jgi:hypothetical protein
LGASCVIIKGGFEGLGDLEMDENHVTQKPMRDTFFEQTTQQVTPSNDNSTTFTRLNYEVNVIPVSDLPESSNAKSSNARDTISGYPYWPWQTPAVNIPTLPENNSELVPTNENKKVRIKGYVEVKQITELGLEQNDDELIDAEPKKKYQSSLKRKYAYEYDAPRKLQKEYPLVVEENRPEIKIEYERLKYKSSSTVTEPKLENINGQFIKSSSTIQIKMKQKFKK